jgi:hypothetical protein
MKTYSRTVVRSAVDGEYREYRTSDGRYHELFTDRRAEELFVSRLRREGYRPA